MTRTEKGIGAGGGLGQSVVVERGRFRSQCGERGKLRDKIGGIGQGQVSGSPRD